MSGLYLDRFFWWNQFRLTNFTLYSEENCSFYPAASQNFEYLSPRYIFLDKDERINVLESLSTEIVSKIEKKPALQIGDLSINLHSIFEPVIDINASSVTINVVTENDVIQIGPSIEIPLTVVRVGDWTLDELFAMIPSPPKEESFPKLGIVNITNAKILSHTIQDGVTTVSEIKFPDEFFYPLFQLTSLAGVNGTDRTIISTVVKKSIIMVLRKHVANDQGFISKTMESFLLNLQKSSEFMSEATDFLYDKVQEWTGIIDGGVGKASRAVNKFITKVEMDFQNAIQDENNPLSRLSKEAKFAWEGIDENLTKAGYTVASVLGKIENDLDALAQSRKLKDGWDTIKKSFREVEDDLHLHVQQVEENIGEVINAVTKDIFDGMDKAKQQFYSLFDGLKDENARREL